MNPAMTPQATQPVRITLSAPDARQLLALLETSSSFPDVLDDLRSALNQAFCRCGHEAHGVGHCGYRDEDGVPCDCYEGED